MQLIWAIAILTALLIAEVTSGKERLLRRANL